MFIHDYLRLGTESQVCDKDVAPIVEQLLGKAEVDTWLSLTKPGGVDGLKYTGARASDDG